MNAMNAKITNVNDLSWNRLRDLSHTSKNRKLLAGIVHAENACIADGPSHHIRDNRTVANIVHRAIQNNWDDVLVACATSRHMTLRDYADIIQAPTTFTEDVYLAILNSAAAESLAVMGMLEDGTRYPAVEEGANAARVTLLRRTIAAINANPEAYAVEDGEEHQDVFRAVTDAVWMDRLDLVAELVATGCTGSFTAKYTAKYDLAA
ncbi:MAG TPA: hypothetical protein VF867_07385 [Arthrobacter sp.]